VAAADVPVLILGESGSGKELFARAIHARSLGLKAARQGQLRRNSSRVGRSELFVMSAEASLACRLRKGWFERADSGTLFLDEVGEFRCSTSKTTTRTARRHFRTRWWPAHSQCQRAYRCRDHRNLMDMSLSNRFGMILVPISVFRSIFALRERPEDIPALVEYFAARAGDG